MKNFHRKREAASNSNFSSRPLRIVTNKTTAARIK